MTISQVADVLAWAKRVEAQRAQAAVLDMLTVVEAVQQGKNITMAKGRQCQSSSWSDMSQ